MEFKEVVKNRFSCKKYSSRKLEPSKLEAILEAGRLAPTAKNLQEQHVYVVQSEEILTKIDGVTPCRYGAPVVLVVAFDKNNVFTYPGGKRWPRQMKAWTAAGSISSTLIRWQRQLTFRKTKRS